MPSSLNLGSRRETRFHTHEIASWVAQTPVLPCFGRDDPGTPPLPSLGVHFLTLEGTR